MNVTFEPDNGPMPISVMLATDLWHFTKNQFVKQCQMIF